jgi:hypothetical protein
MKNTEKSADQLESPEENVKLNNCFEVGEGAAKDYLADPDKYVNVGLTATTAEDKICRMESESADAAGTVDRCEHACHLGYRRAMR